MKILIPIFIGLLFLTACQDKGYGTQDITYIPSITATSEVKILSSTPSDIIAQKAYITLEFSSYMYEKSLNTSHIYLELDSNTTRIPIAIEVYQNKIQIKPLVSLIDTQTYTLYISKNIQDIMGNTLIKDYSKTYTCASNFWQSVEAGSDHAMAQSKSGDIFIWGSNAYKQIIDIDEDNIEINSTTINKSIPLGITSSNGTLSYSAGENSSAMITKENTLYSIGQYAILNASDTNLSQISAGTDHTAFIKSDGTLWSWGKNTNGQLGNLGIFTQLFPVQEFLKNETWTEVRSGENFSIALRSDGSLWGWGTNSYGQIGDTLFNERLTPKQEDSNATDWKKISAGTYHSIALKTDGSLWGFGKNDTGQLGDATNNSNSVPVQESKGDTDWLEISAGYNHTCAIKTTGTLWCWGSNSYGQLGTNDKNSTNTPNQEDSNSTTWTTLSAGKEFTIATKSDGTLWVWGKNTNYQLGLGYMSDYKLIPTEVK